MKTRFLTLAIIHVVLAGTSLGQVPIRRHVYLPRTHGATVLSTHIDAEARRLVALGDFLESSAVARRINIEADREAMKNSVLWVETYFMRRKLNMEYRDDLRIDYAESQLMITSATHRRIVQGGSLGDVTDEIHFMMNRLNADAVA